MIFRTPCLQHNGDQVLCGHDPCWNAFDVNLNGFSYCYSTSALLGIKNCTGQVTMTT